MSKRCVAFLGGALILVAGLLLFGSSSSGTYEIRDFPNGYKVKILKVTYGTNHVLTDPQWKLTLRKLTPTPLRKHLGTPLKGEHKSERAALVLWTQVFQGNVCLLYTSPSPRDRG